MALPYTFQCNFEFPEGTFTTAEHWDSQSDTQSQMDFPHYTELARSGMRPHSGAYCMRLQLDTATAADSTSTEDAIDIADAGDAQCQFWLYFSNDFTATAEDDVNLLELSAGGTVEFTFGFRISAAGVITLGIGETAPTSFGPTLEKGAWHLIELHLAAEDGTSTDGAIDIWVTKEGAKTTASAVHATQVGSLSQGAITTGSLGLQEALTTTSGTILIDDFLFSAGAAGTNTRTRQDLHPWSNTTRLTESGHAFVGPGRIDNITLVAAPAQGALELRLWDTDRGRSGVFGHPIVELHNTGTGEIVDPAGMPVYVTKGAFVELFNTEDMTDDASALIQIGWASAWGDESAIIRHGLRTS
jgi:hypothetical protein